MYDRNAQQRPLLVKHHNAWFTHALCAGLSHEEWKLDRQQIPPHPARRAIVLTQLTGPVPTKRKRLAKRAGFVPTKENMWELRVEWKCTISNETCLAKDRPV